MSGYTEIAVDTDGSDMVEITARVREIVHMSGVHDGLCFVFSKHTTAGLTINENADPDVRTDLIRGMSAAFPDRPDYRHAEGNSPAHIKTSCIGPSVTLIVSGGELVLGTWQGIFLCDFDGPRTRRVIVKVTNGRRYLR